VFEPADAKPDHGAGADIHAAIVARLGSLDATNWRTPDLDAIFRAHRPALKRLSLAGRLDLARQLFAAGRVTDAHIANRLLSLSVIELGPNQTGYLDEMAELLTEWGNVDTFCIDVMQPLLARHPDMVLALVREWNRSAHVWKRRASIVTFTRKVGESGCYTPEVLALCEPLLRDPHDLVRKAVGWALKDNLRGDRERVLAYVKDLRRRGVSSIITLYAIRDLRGAEREAVLSVKAE
jgi:3-methyladenine DNA glycosylase AlkD